MRVDIQGLVDSIRLGEAKNLIPVFEAVINSIHAIQELKIADGLIDVEILRDFSELEVQEASDARRTITGFTIRDNGAGFNKGNFDSFLTSYSRKKKLIGGKGFGRFTWLKVFDKVSVSSIFEADGKYYQREFNFAIPNGVLNDSLIEVEPCSRITEIRLEGFKPLYQVKCPKKAKTIASKIIEHSLSFFLSNNCPKIRIKDDDEDGLLILNDIFNEELKGELKQDAFTVKGKQFKITHVKLDSTEIKDNQIYYCANDREVFSEKLSLLLPNLVNKLQDKDGGSYICLTYVSGGYLDEKVNTERTMFDIPEKGDINFPDLITLQDIREQSVESVKDYLKEYLQEIDRVKQERIENFINYKAPQYKYLLKKREEFFATIPPDIQESELEIILYKIHTKLKSEIKQEADELFKDNGKLLKSQDDYKNVYKKFFEKVNDVGRAELAEYVMHRRVVLDLLDKRLKLNEDGKYFLEEDIHELIYPLNADSNEIEYSDQNLWIVDEKLSYHRYLASDKALNTYKVIDSTSRKRPDISIFNRPIVFSGNDHYSSVVIIEFKRPERDQYSKENPIQQVFDYIEEIEAGKVKDKDGRTLRFRENTSYFIYIICDINSDIEKFAKQHTLKRTTDQYGFFGLNPEYNAYIEIIPYDKLLEDAKQRNQILFEKLGLTAPLNHCVPTARSNPAQAESLV